MQYPIEISGFENRGLALKPGGFWSGPKLMIDGKTAPKGPKRGQYALRRNDGQEVIASIKTTNFLDNIPPVVIDGKTITLAEPLKWYQWAWSILPVALVLLGGAIGAVFGLLATYLNASIFRSARLKPIFKYPLTAGVSLSAVAIYVVVASLFGLTINGFAARQRTFSSQEGGFSVSARAAFKESTQQIQTDSGSVDLHQFVADQGNTGYIVAYSDYPDSVIQGTKAEDLLNRSRNGAVTNSKGLLISDTPLQVSGYPARDVIINGTGNDGGTIIMYIRYVLVRNRLYQVMFLEAGDNGENPAAAEFLNSFTLLEK